MFVMEFLADVLANSLKKNVIELKSDDGRVDSELTRRNMQHFTTIIKTTEGGKGFGYSSEECGTFF